MRRHARPSLATNGSTGLPSGASQVRWILNTFDGGDQFCTSFETRMFPGRAERAGQLLTARASKLPFERIRFATPGSPADIYAGKTGRSTEPVNQQQGQLDISTRTKHPAEQLQASKPTNDSMWLFKRLAIGAEDVPFLARSSANSSEWSSCNFVSFPGMFSRWRCT